MFSQVTESISQRFGRWIAQRIPPSAQKTLSHREIFVLPTRWGLIYGVMVMLIMVTGINYQNSMILAVGLFLVAIFILSIVITYRNLAGLSLSFHRGQPCFAGELAGFEFILSARESGYPALEMGWVPDQFIIVDVKAHSQDSVIIECRTKQRGVFNPGRMLLTTTYPLGLIRSWSWQDMQAETLVYPSPITAASQVFNSTADGQPEGVPSTLVGQEDFAGLKAYVPGESLHRVAWKKYAQTGEFFSKEFSRPSANPDWVDFSSFQVADTELRLSYMCALVIELNQKGSAFGLKMPGLTLEPKVGMHHFQRCLRVLAMYPNHAATSL